MDNIAFCLLGFVPALAIFQLLIPPVLDGLTKNSWIKLPYFLFASSIAGISISLLQCNLVLLFLLWGFLAIYCLQVKDSPEFEERNGYKMNWKVFYVSHFSYIVSSCFISLQIS